MVASISVDQLHVSYYGKEAVRDVSFSIIPGSLVGIIGPNGAGKSTLLKAVLGLIPSDKGIVKVRGGEVKLVRKKLAYVPQRSNIDWDFPISVIDTVLIGTYPKLKIFKRPKKEDKKLAMECLEKVGMAEFKNRQIGELSGGQQQRVFLARALAQQAEIFFLDEPFVGIDISSEETIIKVLKELRDQGKTILVVHHDLSKANDYFQQLILLNQELIKFGNVDEVMTPETISRAYQGQLSFLKELVVTS
ncbi:metal ABC transporter ATP-binding protein [Virgibacillus halodenitrificans]|uniref:metal ABC transporter ATP-binding protein n=1 Tax=Virgibacillus halodenitrificans TaxID=1482 RepID=UPI00045C3517|nr:metal ABC transporter ATP-binding protein [Virgibacillus halodenitrificans]MCG1026910.1 metal ABC transporter ATP-binding protein [Virgibacillus halodenitrificans]CDQ30768.1 putative zinc transport system ATP-binding protein AdcC [Virgibacillus halodenitrificans]